MASNTAASAKSRFSAEDVLQLVEGDWDIAGEVCCSYSDDDFEIDENENEMTEEVHCTHHDVDVEDVEDYEL